MAAQELTIRPLARCTGVARATLRLAAALAVLTWVPFFVVSVEPKLAERYTCFSRFLAVGYEWGRHVPGAVRVPTRLSFWGAWSFVALFGGAAMTTLANRVPEDPRRRRGSRMFEKSRRLLAWQLPPFGFWSRWCGGMSVRDALVVGTFTAAVIAATVSDYTKLAKRLQGPLNAGLPERDDIYWIRTRYLARSLGTATTGPMILLFGAAPHSSVLQEVFRLDYHQMVRYHRWCGWGMIWLVVAHGAGYYVCWIRDGQWAAKALLWSRPGGMVSNLAGSIAGLCAVGIGLTALEPVRRRFFEVFYRCHVVFFLGFLVFGALHAPIVYISMAPGLILLVVDLVLRSLGGRASAKPTSALVHPSGHVAQLTFRVKAGGGWAGDVGPEAEGMAAAAAEGKGGTPGVAAAPSVCPLRRIYLAMDSHSRWESHPFSVSSSTADGRVTVAIKRYGKFTSRLLDDLRAGKLPALRAHLPREPTSIRRWRSEDALLIVAGGIGAAAATCLLEEIAGARRAWADAEASRRRHVGEWPEGAPGAPLDRGPSDSASEVEPLAPGDSSAFEPAFPTPRTAPPDVPRRIIFAWVARDPSEFLVATPGLVAEGARPSTWLDLRLFCTGAGAATAAGTGGRPASPPLSHLGSLLEVSRLGASISSDRDLELGTRKVAGTDDGDGADDADDADGGNFAPSDRGSRGRVGATNLATELSPSGPLSPASSTASASRGTSPSRSGPPMPLDLPPVRLLGQRGSVWVATHLLSFAGAACCVALAGSYRAEAVAYAVSHGADPALGSDSYRGPLPYSPIAQTGFWLLGLLVGGIGVPFVAFGLAAAFAACARAARRKGGRAASAPPVGAAGGDLPNTADAGSPDGDLLRVSPSRLSLTSTGLSVPIQPGRPDIAQLLVDAAAGVEGRNPGTVGVYLSGPDGLNEAVHLAIARRNFRAPRGSPYYAEHALAGNL